MANKAKQNIDELSTEWLQARPGERFLIRIPASATDGLYSITEIVASPGDSTPVHVHRKEDEHLSFISCLETLLSAEVYSPDRIFADYRFQSEDG